jgi:hypothetical protein
MPLTTQVLTTQKGLVYWRQPRCRYKYSIQASLKRRPARRPLAICPKLAEGLPASVSASFYGSP